MPIDDDELHGHATGVVCARCGKRRQSTPAGRGWRYFRRGVGYCDECAHLPGPWLLGPGAFKYSAPLWENF